MGKFTIVRGVSGSGKSTWASNQNAVVVSRDLIRLALFGEESMQDEAMVTTVEHAAIAHALRAGKDVISDNTNIEWKFVRTLADIAWKAGADVEIKVFDVPLADCIRRNDKRAAMGGRMVPHDVIKRQHQRFQGTKGKTLELPFVPKPYAGTDAKPHAFLVDIDGTLAHMQGRSPFDWKRVGEDSVDQVIADIVNDLADSNTVIVMSGRDGSCRAETEAWLYKHDIFFDALYMREAGDMRKDSIVKAELFDKYIRDNFNVRFVLDDRQQVVDMWRNMGLTCLQVAPGDF